MLAHDWLYVWDDGGAVSSTRIHETVNGVVRISFVYTLPERRRRGYASALVAEVSERALAQGAQRVMLYADASNPTTNAIYQAVGYRRVGEAREYGLVLADNPSA
jgi:predicted GNAT family acetyltransferase